MTHAWPDTDATTDGPSGTAGAAGEARGRHRGDPVRRPLLRTWLVTGLVLVGLALFALATASYFGATLGVRAGLVALAAAILPLGIVVPTFLWLDRFEAEPARYLVLAFLWGALVASFVAALTNTGFLAVLEAVRPKGEAEFLTATLAAPLVEEAMKGVFVLLVWWFLRRELDGVVDGMVYAGLSATGFAFTENIQYLGLAYTTYGRDGLTGVLVARGLMSPFAHPMFTILTGVGVGVAATSRSRWVKVVAPLVGYLLACLCHSLWNLAALSGGSGLVTVYLLVEVPIFLVFAVLVVRARAREGRIIGQFLRPYADAGWLAPSEVTMLASMGRRREARIWARANGGRKGLRAMRGFQDTASELALLRRRMNVSGASERDLATERSLLDALTRRRRFFVGRALV